MRALVITGPGHAEVLEVAQPVPGLGEVVVDVVRAGICGTDVELYTGEMAYLREGLAAYPLRIGHEWAGTVAAVGDGVDSSWLGRRVTGDTMLGCGACARCVRGYQHTCAVRTELGVRGGRPGALADQVSVPASSLHMLPDEVDDVAGALVEPGANAFRAVQRANLQAADRVVILGAGTIGLLAALFARALGAEVHLVGRSERSLVFARRLGFGEVWAEDEIPRLPWDAVIDASNAAHLPAKAIELVEPGKRVVYIGLAGGPSAVDARRLVLADVTAVGVLGGSPAIADTIDTYAQGRVDPRPIVATTVALEGLPAVLAGERPQGSGLGPKFHVEIRPASPS